MTDTNPRPIPAQLSAELRRSVLRPNLAPGSALPGDDEPNVLHLGAFQGETLASACLIFPEPCPWFPQRRAWRLRSMATEPAARGVGLGRLLLIEAARQASAASAEILWCLAREGAVGFYLHSGWQGYGELFDTDLGPHLRMWQELTRAS
jgi:GNAT superfamily N-acetyltransferase